MGLFGGPNVDKLATKRDLKGLAKALTNGDPEVRASAGRALAAIDGDDAVHAVAERLDGQQDEAVIDSGVGALRAMGNRAAPVLLTGLRESSDDRKPLYGALLGRLGAQHGLAPLLEATHDSDPTVRGTAAFGLALIDDLEARKRIIAVFQTDEDMDARGLAAMALGAKKLPGRVGPPARSDLAPQCSARSKASTSGSSRGRATPRPSRCQSGLESTSAS
jgi:HEAT repeat protein